MGEQVGCRRDSKRLQMPFVPTTQPLDLGIQRLLCERLQLRRCGFVTRETKPCMDRLGRFQDDTPSRLQLLLVQRGQPRRVALPSTTGLLPFERALRLTEFPRLLNESIGTQVTEVGDGGFWEHVAGCEWLGVEHCLGVGGQGMLIGPYGG